MNSAYPLAGGANLLPIDSSGVKKTDGTNTGFTVTAATYYWVLPSTRENLVALHLKWAAAVNGTFTVETCNFPEYDTPGTSDESDRGDVTDFSTSPGDWIQENPSTAIAATVGAGNSSTALTVTAGGTNAGGCTFHLGNIGTRRCRIKGVFSVGGLVRAAPWGKGV